MTRDLAVDEIRAVRHRISARYNHDTRRLLQHYREMEKQFQNRLLFTAEEPLPRPKAVVRSKTR